LENLLDLIEINSGEVQAEEGEENRFLGRIGGEEITLV